MDQAMKRFSVFLFEYLKFIAITACIYSIYKCFKITRTWLKVRKLINVLPGPETVPFFGNLQMFTIKENIFITCLKIAKKYGTTDSPVRLWIGPKPVLIIHRPEDAAILFNSPNSLEKESVYQMIKKFLGDGLLTSDVQTWKRHRLSMNPMFNQKLLESFIPKFENITEKLVNRLKCEVGKGHFDFTYYVAGCLLDFACEGLMGISSDVQFCESTKHFIKSVMSVMEITQKRFNSPYLMSDFIFALSGYQSKQIKHYSNVRPWIDKVIAKKIEKLGKSQNMEEKLPQSCILGQLIAQTNNDSDYKWTMEEVVNEVDTLLITAVDTSGSTIAFTLMMLGIHQDIQDKVYQEIYNVFGDSDRRIEAEDLRKFKYIERVLKETLRLFPVAPILGRMTTGPVKLENFTIPKGVDCFLAVGNIQKDPKYWGENSLEFDPDRFLPENSEGRHVASFLAFSIGPRNCIGTRYSYITMKILLISMLRNYKINCNMKLSDIKTDVHIVSKIEGGFKISIENRNVSSA